MCSESKIFDTVKEAKAHAARMAEEVEGPGHRRSRRPDGRAVPRKWLDGLKAREELSPATLANYQKNIDRLVARIGTRKLAQVRPGDLEDVYTQMLKSGGKNGAPLAAASVRLCHNIAHIAFEAARKRKLIRENPARDASPPKADGERKVRPFTDEEIGRCSLRRCRSGSTARSTPRST